MSEGLIARLSVPKQLFQGCVQSSLVPDQTAADPIPFDNWERNFLLACGWNVEGFDVTKRFHVYQLWQLGDGCVVELKKKACFSYLLAGS